MANSLNLEVPRQGDFVREYELLDQSNAPIDLTGHTLAWSAREAAGSGSVIASATIIVVEAVSGRFRAKWHGPDFDAVGEVTEIVRVAHDLKHTYPGGEIDVPIRGELIIYPEVTA